MKKEAVGYVRVSGKGQMQGTGFDRQMDAIKLAGYQITEWYKESHTGTEANRPVFNGMLEDLLANGCRTIVVESLDRLARDLTIQLQLVAYLATHNIEVISANTGQNVTEAMKADPMQKAMIQMQGVFAELDKSLLVRKLAKGREKKRERNGYCEGRKPFGDRTGEAEILARMRQLHRKPRGGDRLGPYQIATILNDEGHTTRTGIPWHGSTVRQILERAKR